MKAFVLLCDEYDEPLLAVTFAKDEQDAKDNFKNTKNDDIYSYEIRNNLNSVLLNEPYKIIELKPNQTIRATGVY